MHYRQRQAMNKRQRGGGREAREVDFPIPLQGLFVDAKSADVSGLYAAKLNNFRTDGVLIETRRQSVLGAADQLVLQRIPFQFGANPRYIDLRADQAETHANPAPMHLHRKWLSPIGTGGGFRDARALVNSALWCRRLRLHRPARAFQLQKFDAERGARVSASSP